MVKPETMYEIARVTDKDGNDKTTGVHSNLVGQKVSISIFKLQERAYIELVDTGKYLHTSRIEMIFEYTRQTVEDGVDSGLRIDTRNTIYYFIEVEEQEDTLIRKC